MNGVEILSSEQVVVAWQYGWTAFWSVFALIWLISVAVGYGYSLYTEHWSYLIDGAIIGIVAAAFIAGMAGSVNDTPSEYANQYKVILTDEVSMNEFTEKYDIISQEGKIYTVREKNKFQDELIIETKETETETEIEPDTFTSETETEPIVQETETSTEESEIITNDIIEYPLYYSDATCEIEITKEWYENAWVYAAHLIYTDYDRLGTSCADGTYNTGYETTTAAAERLGAVLTVNGCYSAPYLNYTVVRDGVIWNGSDKNLCLPAIYSSDNGFLLNTWETGGCDLVGRNVAQLVDEKLLTDTFCFGPPFLADGEILVKQDDSRAQRTFMGTNGEAGNIWLVVSDGRWNDGESSGLNGYQCAAYLHSKGCSFGVPLDGGGSSTMVWNGQVLNAVGEANQRSVVDFVYFK